MKIILAEKRITFKNRFFQIEQPGILDPNHSTWVYYSCPYIYTGRGFLDLLKNVIREYKRDTNLVG